MIDNANIQNILLFAVLFMSVIVSVIIIFIIKSRQKIYFKEIEKRNLEIEFQKQMFSKILETQETERKRIARDLHDDISSKLIAVSLNLHLLKSEKTLDSDKENIIKTIENINKNAIDTSRKIAHHLFPPLLENFGVNEALEEIVHEFNSSKQVTINFINQINLNVLEKQNKLNIFRITQELINNSIKHGKASAIYLKFHQNSNQVICEYSDNGIGIVKANFENKKGLGFINIESRIKSINGIYKIDFAKSDGFSIKYFF